MRAKVSVLTLSLVLFGSACGRGYGAESEPAPSETAGAVNPVGGFDFVVVFGGESRNGTLDIRRTASGYAGEATLEGEGDAATITGVTVTGSHVAVALTLPNGGPITFELDFAGNDAFTGMIIARGDVIDVTGRRRGQ